MKYQLNQSGKNTRHRLSAKPRKIFGSLVILALALIMSAVTHAQTRTEKGIGHLLLFSHDTALSGVLSVHVEDIKSIKGDRDVQNALDAVPDIPSCIIAKSSAQDNSTQPILSIDDENINTLNSETLTLLIYWTCDKAPQNIDAKRFFNASPSLKSIIVKSIGDPEDLDMGEHTFELVPGQSSAPLKSF